VKRYLAITSLKHAKRVIKIVIGITIVLLGCAMLILPGPGIVTIVLGLAILGTEFVWAKKLMNRLKREANDIRKSLF